MGTAEVILAGPALALLLERCAPSVSTDTMAAVVGVESAGDELAIGDNTTRRAYHLRDRGAAARLAQALIARGDSVDVGLAQVNSGNFGTYGVTAADVLEPCANVRVGSAILADDYRWASTHFPSPRLALWHALAAYNAGPRGNGTRYVGLVVSEASMGPLVPSIALLTEAQAALPTTPSAGRIPAARPTPRSAPEMLPGLAFSQPAPR
jgi:type IV secretion system protein VirB1